MSVGAVVSTATPFASPIAAALVNAASSVADSAPGLSLHATDLSRMDVDADSILTLVIVACYCALGLTSIVQLLRIYYYKHPFKSFQAWFLVICLLWSSLRTVFFLFGQDMPSIVFTTVYWLPIDLQFLTFSLLVVFYAFLIYRHDWERRRSFFFLAYGAVNLSVIITTATYITIACKSGECIITTTLNRIHQTYMAAQFTALVVVYGLFSYRLWRSAGMLPGFRSSTSTTSVPAVTAANAGTGAGAGSSSGDGSASSPNHGSAAAGAAVPAGASADAMDAGGEGRRRGSMTVGNAHASPAIGAVMPGSLSMGGGVPVMGSGILTSTPASLDVPPALSLSPAATSAVSPTSAPAAAVPTGPTLVPAPALGGTARRRGRSSTSIGLVTLTLGAWVVFCSRWVYNILVAIDQERFGMSMSYGDDGMIDVGPRAFAFLLWWEVLPSVLVLVFFRAVPRTNNAMFPFACPCLNPNGRPPHRSRRTRRPSSAAAAALASAGPGSLNAPLQDPLLTPPSLPHASPANGMGHAGLGSSGFSGLSGVDSPSSSALSGLSTFATSPTVTIDEVGGDSAPVSPQTGLGHGHVHGTGQERRYGLGLGHAHAQGSSGGSSGSGGLPVRLGRVGSSAARGASSSSVIILERRRNSDGPSHRYLCILARCLPDCCLTTPVLSVVARILCCVPSFYIAALRRHRRAVAAGAAAFGGDDDGSGSSRGIRVDLDDLEAFDSALSGDAAVNSNVGTSMSRGMRESISRRGPALYTSSMPSAAPGAGVASGYAAGYADGANGYSAAAMGAGAYYPGYGQPHQGQQSRYAPAQAQAHNGFMAGGAAYGPGLGRDGRVGFDRSGLYGEYGSSGGANAYGLGGAMGDAAGMSGLDQAADGYGYGLGGQAAAYDGGQGAAGAGMTSPLRRVYSSPFYDADGYIGYGFDGGDAPSDGYQGGAAPQENPTNPYQNY